MRQGSTQPVMDAVQQAEVVIAAVYAVPTPGKVANAASVQDASAALLQEVLRTAAAKTVVVAMGNPYIAAQFPETANVFMHILQRSGF